MYLPGENLQFVLHPKEFSKIDGSQLAMVSIDPVSEIPSFLRNLKIVALLGRDNLSLFVRADRKIDKLSDLTPDSSDKLVIGARSAAAEFAALSTFESLDVPIELVSPGKFSDAKEQLESGKLDVLIEPLSNYRPGIEPTIIPINVDLHASFDHVLVAPANLEQPCYEKISEDLHKLYENTEFQEEVRSLHVLPQYLAGIEYVKGLQEVGSKFCKKCSCSKKSCKKKCPKKC